MFVNGLVAPRTFFNFLHFPSCIVTSDTLYLIHRKQGDTGMTSEMKTKIARMQTKRQNRPEIWKNDNGTFSHHKDGQRQWHDYIGCATDLRFHREWEASEND